MNVLNNNKLDIKHKSEPGLHQKKVIRQESDIQIETDAVPPAASRIGRSNSKMTVGSKRSSSGHIKNATVKKRLPKCVEPSRAKSHWDYLLDEMTWMAVDFYQEVKWKQSAAKHFAFACQAALHQKRNQQKDDENWRKRMAANIATSIRAWWTNLNTLAQYQLILQGKKSEQKQLNLRPRTPENSDEFLDTQSELAQLIDDSRKPIHMICDIERLYPDKSKKAESIKLPDSLVKEAEMLKQRVIEMTEVKNIDHTFNLDIHLSLYQQQGIRWLIDSRKYRYPCHLADERGLAKRTQLLVRVRICK